MTNVSHQKIKEKSLAGISALLARQFFIKVIIFSGNIFLARILAPQVFGIYAIVSFVVQFFSIFGDVGIGAALIQKKQQLSNEELSTIFWVQQILVWLVVGFVFIATPLALKVYPTLPPAGIWLIRGMALSLIFTSLKTVPAILMERQLDFNRIAWVDIAENVCFQVAAIYFALVGFGVWSFIIAAVIRSGVGALLIYLISSWRPTFQCRFASIKQLLGFGFPYQGNQILSFIKDAVAPLFVGAYAGAAAVGYVNWARSLAFAPLMLTESFGRVAFPAFSRLQEDKNYLSGVIERSIRIMTLVMFPITGLLGIMGPEITHLIFTDKWLPGIWAFYFYCTSPAVIGIVLPMYSAILAMGNSKILLKMTFLLFILEWGLGIPFVLKFGFNGIAFSQPIISVIFIFVYKSVLNNNNIFININHNIRYQLISILLTMIVVKFICLHINVSMLLLPLIMAGGTLLFVATMFLINRHILFELKEYFTNIVRSQGKAK